MRHEQPDGTTRTWSSKRLDAVGRYVCANCNHGWLATLEGQAKPIVTRMLNGTAIVLSDADQRTLAVWAVKTAAMLDMPGAIGSISMLHREALTAQSEPRVSTIVWIGRYSGKLTANFHVRQLFFYQPSRRQRVAGYLATLTVGSVVFQVLGTDLEAERASKFTVDDADSMSPWISRIWPSMEEVTWPPARSLSDEGLQQWGDGYITSHPGERR